MKIQSLWSALAACLFLIVCTPLRTIAQPITTGLIGYWNFDDNPLDQSPSANHGTLVGPSLATDRHNLPSTCYNFELNEYISLGDPVEYDFGSQDFTVSTWVYRTKSVSNDHNFILGKWQSGGNPGNNEWALIAGIKNVGNFPHFGIEAGSQYYGITSSLEIDLNRWYHLVAVKRATSIELYINSLLVASMATPLGVTINNVPGLELFFGNFGNGNFFMDGCRIDETMLFNRALSVAEIELLLEQYKAVRTYKVQQAAAIQHMYLAEQAIVYTGTGATYVVQSDSLAGFATDTCAVIPTQNGNYAILQPRDGGYYIEDFGAIANDGLDDSEAIQKCIDAALLSPLTSKVNVGVGLFDLDKGVVASQPYDATEYANITLTVSGNIPVYGKFPDLGSVSTFNLRDSTFCLAIQEGRNCLIENIMFVGAASDYQSFTYKQMVEHGPDDWGKLAGARRNRYSPSCAVVIDPFDSTIAVSDRYPGHAERYTNGTTGGTSMLTIKGCGFRYHYIGIANNPSNQVKNGDNIRAENCRVSNLHTFWAAGQSQSRSNSIDNVYSISVNRFVDCYAIGTRVGTPPVITNCNLAGFTKELVHMRQAGRSTVRIANTYAEALFSLGYINARSVSFHQCQLKFISPSQQDGIYAAPYHLRTGGILSFVDCDIAYNVERPAMPPFRLLSKGVNISGGNIKGGIMVNGPTKHIDTQLFNYDNVSIEHTGQVAGRRWNSGPASQCNKLVMLGGDEFRTYQDGTHVFKNNGETYNRFAMGVQTVVADPSKERAYMVVAEPGWFKPGDNLMSSSGGTINSSVLEMVPYQTAFGYVSEVVDDTVFIDEIPYGFTYGSMLIHLITYPVFFSPTWGDISSGSKVITNVVTAGSDINKWLDHRIYDKSGAIPVGAYVTAVDAVNNTLYLSVEAIQSVAHGLLYNAKYEQTVYRDSAWPATVTAPYISGCQILFKTVQPTVYGQITKDGGIVGGAVPPVFGGLTF